MRVKVLLFARLRDLVGAPEIVRDVPGGAAIGDVWSAMVADHAGLAPYTATLSCARNEEFARLTTPVAEGDCIAFLPPVSGG